MTTREVEFFNANDGFTGRDGGPYMDIEDAKQAERIRAEIEGREPDLKNPPATAGQVLVSKEQLLAGGPVLPASMQRQVVDFTAPVVATAEVEVPDPEAPLSPLQTGDNEDAESEDEDKDSKDDVSNDDVPNDDPFANTQTPAEPQSFNES